jgi:hypothetical protein
MTEIDFTGFLLAHKCMRREYSRLAEAARHPRGVRHQALIEEHIAVTLSVLHHHHAEEDNWLWPTLRERAPAARPSLDRLEAQHTQLDSLPMRAPVFAELHEAINAHFDEEEQLILPLGTAHVSAENGRLSVSGHSRRSSAGTCRSCWAGCLAKRRPQSGRWCGKCCRGRCVSWLRRCGFRPTPSAVVASTPSPSTLPGRRWNPGSLQRHAARPRLRHRGRRSDGPPAHH